MNKLVVTDTTPIILLARIKQLNILKRLYGEILIPEGVFSELMRGKKKQPGVLEVLNMKWIKAVKVKNRSIVNKLNRHLDLGESEAIALSIETKADVLIIDERKGRAVAQRMRINIIGTIGVLIKAKREGKIPVIRPYLDQLKGHGFRMSKELYEQALEEVGEKTLDRSQNI